MTESILNVTAAAAEKVQAAKTSEGREDIALRVAAREDGAKFRYELKLVAVDSKEADDSVVHLDNIDIYIDSESAPRLKGASLDYVEDISGAGLKFENPNKTSPVSYPHIRAHETSDHFVSRLLLLKKYIDPLFPVFTTLY